MSKERFTYKEIPLNINIPDSLATINSTKFFIYIPNFQNIKLSQGLNFENGLWSITKDILTNTNLIIPKDTKYFQILLIYKNSTEEEITCNIYYQNNKLAQGPFISADYKILGAKNILIKLRHYTPITNFEIEGVPINSILSEGTEIDENTWNIPVHKKDNEIILDIQNSNFPNKINLSISAKDTKNIFLQTTFTLIITLNSQPSNYKNKYKSQTIPITKILNKENIKNKDYLVYIKNIPNYCCIENAVFKNNKWILNNPKKIIINNFNPNITNLPINLEFIIFNKDVPIMTNTYFKRINLDFSTGETRTKNFTKCIICKNKKCCNLFSNFMNSIGDSSILKHIIK